MDKFYGRTPYGYADEVAEDSYKARYVQDEESYDKYMALEECLYHLERAKEDIHNYNEDVGSMLDDTISEVKNYMEELNKDYE